LPFLFNFKLNGARFHEQYKVLISNSFAVLGKLDDDMNVTGLEKILERI
jgi:hypothetical protein